MKSIAADLLAAGAPGPWRIEDHDHATLIDANGKPAVNAAAGFPALPAAPQPEPAAQES